MAFLGNYYCSNKVNRANIVIYVQVRIFISCRQTEHDKSN